jgi:hypothetical protein
LFHNQIAARRDRRRGDAELRIAGLRRQGGTKIGVRRLHPIARALRGEAEGKVLA